MRKKIFFSVLMVVLIESSAFAAHPLITDDTGTQGKRKVQLELNSEFSHEKEDGAAEDGFEFVTVLSYGLADNVDIVLGIPYQFIRLEKAGQKDSENGLSDISIELKWRFYEKDGLSLALKRGLTLPTGDDEKGLGAGKVTYSAFFITSKEIEPWAFHLNLGYLRNENDVEERKNLWHASVGAEYAATEKLKLVGNIGIEQNTDRNVNTHPAFILGGLIYSVSENLDIDFGVKAGLNEPETDYAILAGLAWRF